MFSTLRSILRTSTEAGQTRVEYALILSIISIASIGLLGVLAGDIVGFFEDLGLRLEGVI